MMVLHVLSFTHFKSCYLDYDLITFICSWCSSFCGGSFFLAGCLDVLLMFGAYKTARGFAISRLIIRFLWLAAASTFVTYLYVWVIIFILFLILILSQCALSYLFVWMLNI
jgi:callose synthase